MSATNNPLNPLNILGTEPAAEPTQPTTDAGSKTLGTGKATITVTPKAIERIKVAMAKENISAAEGGFRLGVQGGGCSGLSYHVSFDTQPRQRDRVFEFDGVRIFVDPKSFLYLAGMTLDYEETLMRRGFNFINPNSQKSCGCGTSFTA